MPCTVRHTLHMHTPFYHIPFGTKICFSTRTSTTTTDTTMSCVCAACIAETNQCKCKDVLCTNPKCDAKDNGQCTWPKTKGHWHKPWHQQYCRGCWQHHFPADFHAYPKPKAAAPAAVPAAAAPAPPAPPGLPALPAPAGGAGKGAGKGADITAINDRLDELAMAVLELTNQIAEQQQQITEQKEQMAEADKQITEQQEKITEQQQKMADQTQWSGQHAESIQILENKIYAQEQEIWQLRNDLEQHKPKWQ